MIQQKIDNIANIARSLPPVGYPEPVEPPAVKEDLVAVFEQRLNDLRAPGDEEPALVRVRDMDEAARTIGELCRDVPRSELIWQGDARETVRDRAVGITGAGALIAATGSVIVDLSSAMDGHASLLVDRHIVVAGRGQMLPDLATFYRHVSARYEADGRLPNQVCITGCSRTADIEKVLVVPAHGPRQVCVVLCEAPVDWGALRRIAASVGLGAPTT